MASGWGFDLRLRARALPPPAIFDPSMTPDCHKIYKK